MKLGLQLNSFDWNGGPERFGRTLADIARTAEDADFDRIGVADHLWQHPIMGGPEANEPECYATLAFLAANTERVGLTAMVSGVHFRHPAVLVKTVTTLDVLSGGRAGLGIGPVTTKKRRGDSESPFRRSRRGSRYSRRRSQIALRMWSGERGDERPFEGKHYGLERPLNLPQSLSRPHPPVMIAGDGEKKTLRLVARYADACSLRPGPEIPRKLDVLAPTLRDRGSGLRRRSRRPAPLPSTSAEVGEKADELVETTRAGSPAWAIETVIGFVPRVDRIAPLEIIGREVIPAVADL